MVFDPFTPEEAEFLAEFTLIDIIPAGSLTELELIIDSPIKDVIPAMSPARRASVPLWLAINLRKSTGCQIVPPDWLSPEKLSLMYNDEISSPDSYKDVPFHYIEIATILLENIPNLPESEKIRRLVQCIREARFRKTTEGLKAIDGNPLKIDKLAFMEINEIRPFLLGALDQACRLNSLETEERRRSQMVGPNIGTYGKAVGKSVDDSDSFYSPSGAVASSDIYSQNSNPYAYSSYQ